MAQTGLALLRRFEQLNRVAVGIVQLDLFATRANLHFVAGVKPRFFQPFDASGQIRHAKHDSVPSARLLALTAWHRTRTRRTRAAEQQPKTSESNAGESRELLTLELESKMTCVERDGATYIADLISHAVKILNFKRGSC
jgi:hypothetical protein